MRANVLSFGKDRPHGRQDLEALNLLRQPLWVFDIERRAMWWANQAALALWNAEDLAGLLRRDFASDMSDVTAARLASYVERFEQGEVVPEQWTFYPSGEPITLQCVCSGICIEGGRLAMLVEGHPVSERAAEVDALRGIEALRHTPVMVTLFDLAGRPLFQNPAASSAFGPATPEASFVSRFADTSVGARLWLAVLSGDATREEAMVRTRDGERWHEVRCRITDDPATGEHAVLINQQDVSERRAVEGRYHALFAGSRVPMMLIDPEDGRIIDANPAASAFYGYRPEQLRSLEISDLNTLTAEQIRFEMRRALCESHSHFQFQHRLASGELRDVEVHSGPVLLDGRQLLYSIVLDITERGAAERALRESEHKYRSLVDNTPAGFWLIGRDQRTVQVNGALCRMLGRAEAAMIGRSPLELVDEENATILRAQMARIGDTSHRTYTLTLRHADGREVPAHFSATTLRDSQGAVQGAFAFVTDLTAMRQVEERLRRLSRAVEHTSNSVVITDAEGVIEYVNPHFSRVTGYSPEEAIGRKPSILKSGITDPHVYETLWQSILQGTSWTGELYNRRKDGGLYWSLLTVSPIRNDAGVLTHFVGVAEDITELKEAHARVERLSFYDGLTGLPNRRLFTDRLTQAVRTARRSGMPAALFYLDLDRFKDVNDSLSHDAGDQLLVEVACRLRACVREVDTVARLGGDEFAVLLPDIGTTQGARKAVHKILDALAQPMDLPGLHAPVTASIGITLTPVDSLDPDVLMRNADMAMYGAKGRGRNTYQFFTETMNREVSRRLTVERDLRAAIGTDQLELHYQPVVELATRRIVGTEALLR